MTWANEEASKRPITPTGGPRDGPGGAVTATTTAASTAPTSTTASSPAPLLEDAGGGAAAARPLPPPSFSSSYADLTQPMSRNSNDDKPDDNHYSINNEDLEPSTPRAPFFFADAVLDLSEAHDIADTPEAPSHRTVLNASVLHQLQQPTIMPAAVGPAFSASAAATDLLDDVDAPPPAASVLRAIPPAPFHGDTSTEDHAQQQQQESSQAVLLVPPIEEAPADRPSVPDRSSSTKGPTSALPTAVAADATTTTSVLHSLHSSPDPRQQYRRPAAPPRWPRDVPWAMAFVLLVPTVLVGSILTKSSHLHHQSSTGSPATATSASTNAIMEQVATAPSFRAVGWIALAGSLVSSLVIVHVLYGRMSHNADRRHDAARILTTYGPVLHVAACLGLAAVALTTTTKVSARAVGVALPLYYCARDLFLFQRFVASSSTATTSPSSQQRRRTSALSADHAYAGSSSSSSSSRQAFLQAMVETALDILTRSLNRGSRSHLGRAVAMLVVLQFLVLVLWRAAILSCLETGRVGLLLLVLGAGKWATGTCARFLTYVASGGVAAWFDDQHQLLRQLPGGGGGAGSRGNGERHHGGDGTAERSRGRLESDDADPDRMPEAYRMVDASVYQSVLSLDDIGDEDDDDDLSVDAEYETGGSQYRNGGRAPTSSYRGGGAHGVGGGPYGSTPTPRVTVKSLLSTGMSVSFGSIAQCGLVGGAAQYVYGQVRKYDAARDFVAARRHEYRLRRPPANAGSSHQPAATQLGSPNGFRSMTVESSGGDDQRSGRGGRAAVRCGQRLGLTILHLARTFVRHYSDLAMCHVAAYYKSYRHSARDVAALVEESGVESILEDDITTHVCSCAGGAIAGAFLVLASVLIGGTGKYDDWAVLANLLISFYLSYSLLFAVFEPLRAAIKAFYVSFAQHPESLSQAFPLIYHRLSRLAAEPSLSSSQLLPVSREYARVSDVNDSSSADIQLV